MVKLLFILLFSSFAIAQESIIASISSMNSFADNLKQFVDLNKNELSCPLGKDLQGNLICAKKDFLDPDQGPAKRLVYKATAPNQVPKSLRDVIPLPDVITEKNPLYISVWYENDDFLNDSIKPIESGDDLGYTTGLKLEVAALNNDGVTMGGYIYTGLYTDRVLRWSDETEKKEGYVEFEGWGGKTKLPTNNAQVDEVKGTQNIKFEENSVLAGFINNKQQGKWFLWGVEAGFAKTESQNRSKFLASGVQNAWHKLTNVINYNYIPDENDTKYAGFLSALVGAQKSLFDNSKCSLILKGEGGFSLDSSGRRNQIYGTIDINLGLFKNEKNKNNLIDVSGGLAASTLRSMGGGPQAVFNPKVSINFHRFSILNQFMLPLTKAGFSQNFNTKYTDLDPIHRIGIVFTLR